MWDITQMIDLDNWRIVALLIAIGVLLAIALLFFVSAFALRLKNIRKARSWTRREETWDPVLKEVLAGAREPESLSALVHGGDELYFVDYLYRNAKTAPEAELEILSRLARPYIDRIVDRFSGGDPERRARAVHTISVLAFRDHVGDIVRALDDPSPLVAMIAARALAHTGGARHTVAIVDRLDRFTDWSPRFLTSMLAALGPSAAAPLRHTLADPLRPSGVRAVCADALCEVGDTEAADLAASLLDTEADVDVLAASLRLLRRVGRIEHLPAIRRACDSPYHGVRAQAIAALGRNGRPEDTERLRAALSDESAWVALHAARALRSRGQTYEMHQAAITEHVHSGLILQVLAE